MKRLAIITTHPIQYHAPLFRLLSERKKISLKVFYTWEQSKDKVFDERFGAERSWDIPLLEGYEHEFVKNTSMHPDSNRFWGVVNPGLVKQLKNEQFDAILVYRWNLWSHLRIMQLFGGRTKLFFRGDSQWVASDGMIRQLLKKAVLRFVYRKVERVFVVGRLNRDYFLQCGLQEYQLRLASHAVDNDRFQQEEALQEAKAMREREQLSIPSDAIVFVYAGKFYAVKQLPVLIHAFRQLEGDQYRLLLYGSGEQYPLLQSLAEDDSRILFQPFKNQSEMPVVYRTGDVFILPSKHETWGLGVNEAMACGRPAIVSDRCGCAPELIVEGKTGFTFQTGDETDLLLQLRKCSSRSKISEMGKQALLHISKFSMATIAQVIEEEVNKV
jgi:glycosyltransferase involved in cell wall biosynthesis